MSKIADFIGKENSVLPGGDRPQGRPRKLDSLDQQFIELYLDPLFSPLQICQKLRLSLKTFYRYSLESGIPSIRVGVLSYSDLPQKSRLRHAESWADENYHLQLIRRLGKSIRVRFKLNFFDPADGDRAIRQSKVDLAMTSLSWTKERSEKFALSLPYSEHETPSGQIHKIPGREIVLRERSRKPKLGVIGNSVHSEFAETKLRQDFEIECFSRFQTLFEALLLGKVDRTLAHPLAHLRTPGFEHGARLQADSVRYFYQSYTTMVLGKSAEHLLPAINEALIKMIEFKELEEIGKQARAQSFSRL